jgi:hypothetical protein
MEIQALGDSCYFVDPVFLDINANVHFGLNHKLWVLAYSREHKNVSRTCRYFGIFGEPYYKWKRDLNATAKR